MKKLILTALAIVGLQGVSIQGAASAQAAAFGAKAWNFMQGMNAVAIPIIGAGLGYNWYQSNEIAKPVAAKVGQAVEQVGQIAHSMNQAEIFRGILSQLAVQAMIKHSNFLENYGIKLTDEHKKFFNIQPEKDLSNWDKAKNVGKWFDSKLIGGASKIQAYLGIISLLFQGKNMIDAMFARPQAHMQQPTQEEIDAYVAQQVAAAKAAAAHQVVPKKAAGRKAGRSKIVPRA